MIKRTLILTSACHVGVKNKQLFYTPKENDSQPRIIPLEDIGFLIVESQSVTLSANLIQLLNKNGTAVIFCDETHHPCCMLQNFKGHSTHAEILRRQIEASLPTKKKLWQEIVKDKIRNQAALLSKHGKSGVEKLKQYADNVKSDDSDNREAAAARVYWANLFDVSNFKRDIDGEGLNPLLNYGYAILRAASARALTGSGLYCAIGLHHRNRYNSFCLADDFMEPYRPYVDQIVCVLTKADKPVLLTPKVKQELLKILTCDVVLKGMKHPLMIGLSQSSASLVKCLFGKEKKIFYPKIR